MSPEQFALPPAALNTSLWDDSSSIKIHWDTEAGKSTPNLTLDLRVNKLQWDEQKTASLDLATTVCGRVTIWIRSAGGENAEVFQKEV